MNVILNLLKTFVVAVCFSGLVACDSGESFLDREDDHDNGGGGSSSAKIALVELFLGGLNNEVILTPGQSKQLAVRVTFEDKSVMWGDSSDIEYHITTSGAAGTLIDIDKDGLLTAIAESEKPVSVTATYRGLNTLPVSVVIQSKTIIAIQLTPPDEHKLIPAAKALFRIDVFYNDDTSAQLPASTFSASDWVISHPDRIKLDLENNMLEALQPGTATFYIQVNDVRSNIVTVVVASETVQELILTPLNATVAIGGTEELTVTGLLSDDSLINLTSSVQWSATTDAVDISDRGILTGKKEQSSTEVTASFSGHSSNVEVVTVKGSDIVELQLSPVRTTLSLSDTTSALSLVALYADGTSLPYSGVEGVEYEIDNSNVSIGNHGVITPSGEGVALVRAKARNTVGDWVWSNQVTLIVSASPLVKISLSADANAIPKGITTHVYAIGEYADGRKEDITGKVDWQSSDVNTATIVDGLVTGISPGDTGIIASLNGITSLPVLPIEVTDATFTRLDSYPVSPQPDIEGKVLLPVGTSGYATAVASFSDGSVLDVTELAEWHSNNTKALLIDTGGTFFGFSENQGNAGFYARLTIAGITQSSAPTPVTVTGVEPLRLDIVPNTVTTAEGVHTELQAFATYDTFTKNVTSEVGLYWSGDKSDVAIVTSSSDRKESVDVLAVTQGQAIIKAEWPEHGLDATSQFTVENNTLSEILLQPVSQKVVAGESTQMTVLGIYSDSSLQDITKSVTQWTSSDDQIASVSLSGEVVAHAAGRVSISVDFEGKSADAEVIVPEAEISAIQIGLESSPQLAGTKQYAKAIAILADGSEMDVTASASWHSDKSSVVVERGMIWVKDASASEATISVNFMGSDDQVLLNIAEATLESLNIFPGAISMSEGGTQQFTVLGNYSDNNTYDLTEYVSWHSESAIAEFSLSDKGLLTAQSAGNTRITAGLLSEQVQADIHIIGQTSASSLRIIPDELALSKGDEAEVKVEAEYTSEPGEYVDVTNMVEWSVDTNYALVNQGKVITRSSTSGEAIFATASYAGKQAQLSLTIADNKAVEAIQLSPPLQTLPFGAEDTFTLTAIYSDLSSAVIPNSAAVWSIKSGSGVDVDNGDVTATEADRTAVVQVTYQGESAVATVNTSAAKLESIVLLDNQSEEPLVTKRLAKGQSHQMKLVGKYTDQGHQEELTDNSKVIYHTSNSDVATVTDGIITAHQSGDATIYAEYTVNSEQFTSNSTVVMVSGATIENIAIVPDFNRSEKLKVDLDYSLSAIATLSDNTEVDVTSLVTWDIAGSAIATINNKGILTTTGRGSTDITINYQAYSDSLTVEIEDAAVESLELELPNQTVMIDGTIQLQVLAHYDNNTSEYVTLQATWLSGDDNLAVVGVKTGLVTGVAEGHVTITASFGGKTGSATLEVIDKQVQKIQINAETTSLPEGVAVNLSAVVIYTDGSQDTDMATSVYWNSSHPEHGVVNRNDGKFYGISEGSTEITAYYGGKPGDNSITMTVNDAVVTGVQLSPPLQTLPLGVDNTFILTATYSDLSSAQIPNSEAVWSVDSGSGITVNQQGVVEATEADKSAVVKAIYQGEPALATVNTSAATLESVVLLDNQTGAPLVTKLLAAGQSHQMKVAGKYSDQGHDLDLTSDSYVRYYTSDSEVATITDGLITAHQAGEATIYAQYTSGEEGAAILYRTNSTVVIVSEATISKITIEPDFNSAEKLKVGLDYSLSAIATLSDNTTKVDVTSLVSWETDNSTIATIYKGTLSAKSLGETRVTASYGTYSDTLSLDIGSAEIEYLEVRLPLSQVMIGTVEEAQAFARYDNNTTEDVTTQATWSSSNDNVDVGVNTGRVTGLEEGNVRLFAEFNGEVGSTDITVVKKTVREIQISADTTTLPVGGTANISAVVTYTDGLRDEYMATRVYWDSSEPKYGVVNRKDGRFYGLGQGSTDITASFGDETSNTITITVNDAVIDELQLSPVDSSVAVGELQPYTLKGKFSDGETRDDISDMATWHVTAPDGSETTLASVTDKGVIKANGAGVVNVSATIDSKTVNATLTITEKTVEHIILNGNQSLILNLGQSKVMDIDVIYSDGSSSSLAADDSNLTYLVADNTSSVVAFDLVNSGQLNTVAEGRADIWVTYNLNGDVYIADTVSVFVLSKELEDIYFIAEPNESLKQGEVGAFILEARYSDLSTTDITSSAIWTTDDSNVVSVNKGDVLAGQQNGTATITATFEGKSVSTDLTVDGGTLTRVELSPTVVEIHEGLSAELTLTAYYSDLSSVTVAPENAFWESSNSKVAAYDSGKLRALGEGVAKITATFQNQSASSVVAVSPSDVVNLEIELNQSEIREGETLAVKVNAYFEGAQTTAVDVTDSTLWDTDINVAFISKGVLYGRNAGTTNITASYGGKQATVVNFTVNANLPPDAEDAALYPDDLQPGAPINIDLTPYVTSADGDDFVVTEIVSVIGGDSEVSVLDSGELWNHSISFLAHDYGTYYVVYEVSDRRGGTDIGMLQINVPAAAPTLSKVGYWYGEDSYLKQGTSEPYAKAECEGCSHNNWDYTWIVDTDKNGQFIISSSSLDAVYNQESLPLTVDTYGKDVRLIASHDELTKDLINDYHFETLLADIDMSKQLNKLIALIVDGAIVTSSDVTRYKNDDEATFSDVMDNTTHRFVDYASNESCAVALTEQHKVIPFCKKGTTSQYANVPEEIYSASGEQVIVTTLAFAVRTTDGEVITWGDTLYGGNPNISDGRSGLYGVGELELKNVVDLVSNEKNRQMGALTEDGRILVWGDKFGWDMPTELEELLKTTVFTKAYMGGSFVMGTTEDNTVIAWGRDVDTQSFFFTHITAESPISNVAVGNYAALILYQDGHIESFGAEGYGGGFDTGLLADGELVIDIEAYLTGFVMRTNLGNAYAWPLEFVEYNITDAVSIGASDYIIAAVDNNHVLHATHKSGSFTADNIHSVFGGSQYYLFAITEEGKVTAFNQGGATFVNALSGTSNRSNGKETTINDHGIEVMDLGVGKETVIAYLLDGSVMFFTYNYADSSPYDVVNQETVTHVQRIED